MNREGHSETMKSCLLIIQRRFYSYEKHISEALKAKGYSVEVANDEYPEGIVGKILGKMQIPVIFSITYQTITKRYLNKNKYDLALIFKGRGVSKRLILEMFKSVDRIIGYNWDSFQLNRSPLKWYDAISKYCTFDYRDADRLSLPVIELFSSAVPLLNDKESKYELCCVVRSHSSRIRYIDKIVSILKPERAFISIYEMNFITLVLNFVMNPRLYIKYRKNISFKPLPYSEYSDVMRSSQFTIDYAHYTQTGITMRCFEAITTKTKIITNNLYMSRSHHFDAGDYIVFGENDSPEALVQAYTERQAKPYASRPRTISDFIDDLLAT